VRLNSNPILERENAMRHIHLRDPKLPQVSLCFDQRLQDWQLTDDPARVNCGRCRRMMERQAKYKAKNKQ